MLQSCPTLCDPIDGSPPGSRIPGPGLLGEGLGCGFLQTVKDYSNENSLSSKGESSPVTHSGQGTCSNHQVCAAQGPLGSGVQVSNQCWGKAKQNIEALSEFPPCPGRLLRRTAAHTPTRALWRVLGRRTGRRPLPGTFLLTFACSNETSYHAVSCTMQRSV